MTSILLIEDEDNIRILYETYLRGAGYEVISIRDGRQAELHLQEAQQYDLILLDIMLPGVNGVEIIVRLKAEGAPNRHIPILVLSNLGHEETVEAALREGALEYIIKSDTLPDQILEKVRGVLDARQG